MQRRVLAHLLQGILDLFLLDRVVLLLALATLVLLEASQHALLRLRHAFGFDVSFEPTALTSP